MENEVDKTSFFCYAALFVWNSKYTNSSSERNEIMVPSLTCPSCHSEFAPDTVKPAFVIRGMPQTLVELALDGIHNVACPECVAMLFERGLKATVKQPIIAVEQVVPAVVDTVVSTESEAVVIAPVVEDAVQVAPDNNPVVAIGPVPASTDPILEATTSVSAIIVSKPSGSPPTAAPSRSIPPQRPPVSEAVAKMRFFLGLAKPNQTSVKDAAAARGLAEKLQDSSRAFRVFADAPSQQARQTLNAVLMAKWGPTADGLAASIELNQDDALVLSRICFGYGKEAESIAFALKDDNVIQLVSLERKLPSGKKHQRVRGPNATNVPQVAATKGGDKKAKKQANGKGR